MREYSAEIEPEESYNFNGVSKLRREEGGISALAARRGVSITSAN